MYKILYQIQAMHKFKPCTKDRSPASLRISLLHFANNLVISAHLRFQPLRVVLLADDRSGTADSVERLMGTRAEARFTFISDKAEFASEDLLDV